MQLGFRPWLRNFRAEAAESVWSAIFYTLYYTYLSLFFSVTSRYPIGLNVYERDWDLLVVLDACRPDALRAVADEYPFLTDIETVWSRGSMSEEWMAKTFTTDYQSAVEETALITANRYTKPIFSQERYPRSNGWAPVGWPAWDVVDAADFGLFDPVWKYAREDALRQVPPRVLTDHAIRVHREQSQDLMIVHHLQPHHPFIAEAVAEDRAVTEPEANPIHALKEETLAREEVWEWYLDNLRLVLDEVALLLDNVDADRVAITADHGELYGRFGIYGHPCGVPLPHLRRVPWVETTARDTRSHDPENHRVAVESPSVDRRQQLAELGYR